LDDQKAAKQAKILNRDDFLTDIIRCTSLPHIKPINIPSGMQAKQPIGNNALKSSLVHDLLKRQVVLRKQEQPSAPYQAGVPNL
jgi:hypothetical protein